MKKLMMVFALTSLAAPLRAQQKADSAAFIVRLGRDTTSIERYIRTRDQLIVEAVQRSPSTTIHRLVYDITPANEVRKGTYTVMRPGATEKPTERALMPAPGLIPIVGPFYTIYELAMMRGVAAGTPKASVRLQAGTDTVAIPIERVGRDSVALTNQFAEPMRAHIDASGRLLHLHTPAFTTVERVAWLDLDRIANEFAARDAVGKGLGMLSPRQTYRARVGGANIWVDYSRPAMRGRPVWGALVPLGAVWRTGANDAAHLSTDRTLQLGDLTLAPGTYTLFLEPTANDWSLIVNRQTGMSGLDRDPAQDLGKVMMTRESVEQPIEAFTIAVNPVEGGGRIVMGWDRMKGYVGFTVK